MRVVTQTLENGNVVAKANGKQRTVKPTGNVSNDHARAVMHIADALGHVIEHPGILAETDTRLVWEV